MARPRPLESTSAPHAGALHAASPSGDAAEMIFDADAAGRLVYVNTAWCHALGYTRAEAARLRVADVIAPEHRAAYEAAERAVAGGEAVEELELVLVGEGGRRVVARGHLAPRRSTDGRSGTRGVYRDVTAQHRGEAVRARLVATLEASSDLVALVTRDGRVDYLNRAGRALAGLPDDVGLAGLSVRDLLPEREHRRLLREAIRARHSGAVWQGEASVNGAGGTTVPVSLVLVAHPSTHPGEPPYFVSIVARDLRDRLRAEAALRESESRFRAALEGGSDAFLLLRTDREPGGAVRQFTVVECNAHAAGLFGAPRGVLIGQRLRDAAPATIGALLFERCVRVADSGDTVDEEVETAGRDPRWFRVQVVAVADGVAITCADVTERRRAKRLKDQLIATVSHELRSPLTAVRGALDLLAGTGAALPASQRSLLDMARRNADRMVRLVTDLLDLERLESGTTPLEPEVYFAASLVEAAVDTVREGTAGHVTIDTTALEGSRLAIWGDADRVVQVLVNLMGNAAKFSPPGGTVTASAEADGDFVRFSVRDQGPGIPADQLDRIFERFAQVNASDGRERGGAGLGLAICRAIVQQHGGRIWVESQIGAGSTFHFTLPSAERGLGV